MAKAVGMEPSNYNAFLQGRKGLGAEATCLLLKFTAMTKGQAITAFSKPVLAGQILQLQERGKALTLDNSGWIAQEGNAAADPNNSGSDITSTPKAITKQVADLVSVFQQLDYVTRKSVIDSFVKAPAAANTLPTSQRFNRKRK